MNRKQGFTLIELLFVIAVIAVIASVAILALHKTSQTKRVNKAAVEMQQILQAGMAYYTNQSKWPTKHDSDSCAAEEPDQEDEFVKDYLPNSQTKTIYGNYFCWGKTKDREGNFPRFWVAIKVPTNSSNANFAMNTAKRISARLPNAVTTTKVAADGPNICTAGQSCYVKSEITQSAFASGASGGATVQAVGACQDSGSEKNDNGVSKCELISHNEGEQYKVTFNKCASKNKPLLLASPNYLTMPKDDSGYPVYSSYAQQDGDCQLDPNDPSKQYCNFHVTIKGCYGDKCSKLTVGAPKDGGHVGANYLVTCVPDGSVQQQNTTLY